MREIIQSTQQIYKGRIVDLRLHEVELPDGNTSKREIIYHQGAVAIVALDDDLNVLLVRQFRLAAERITLEIPAGLLEANEDPHEAIIRELREETGYRPHAVHAMGGVFVAPGYTSEYIQLFLARGYTHDPLQQDDDEFVQATKMPLLDALALIETGEIVEAKTIVALLRVARKLGI